MRLIPVLILLVGLVSLSFRLARPEFIPDGGTDSLRYPEEKHFKNLRQLTFGGDNAEAYWSFDSKMVSFQSNNKKWGLGCDQVFYMTTEGTQNAGTRPPMISTGLGRTTCSFFLPGNKTILYASTHLGGKDCPPEPERKPGGKYLWPIYDSYDIFVSDLNGKILRQLTNSPGYDAEATVSPRKDKIVFTSTRNGDLDLYVMDIDGKNVKQITNELGYDGGAFFSPDGKKIVFRASRFTTDEQKQEYQGYLKQGLVAPTAMEIFVCNADGSEMKQVTNLGKANWAPFFLPGGNKIIFSSNHRGTRGFEFNLYTVNLDGTGLEQITYDKVFDSFPMFSPDGRKIIFSSNRNNGGTRDTNLFVADWVESPVMEADQVDPVATVGIKPGGTYYSLIVGVSEYDDSSLNLDNPVKDAKKIREILVRDYSFTDATTELLLNPTREKIMSELYRMRKVVGPQDNLLIFYAGHGYWDEEARQGYWWARDANSKNPSFWLSNSDVREQIRGIKSAHTLLISDACFSGGIFRSRGGVSVKRATLDVQLLYKMPSRRAITSGTMTTVPDRSVFFEFLSKRLTENRNKYLSSQELFDNLKSAVINNSMIVPQDGVIAESGDEGGDFIFLKKN